MAAIRHKLRTRSSSGAPLAFSARAGVVLLKTFASIRPPPDLPPVVLPQSSSASCFTAGAFKFFILSQSGGGGLRKAMTAWPRRLKEAVLFLRFELVDEYSEMPGHGSRKGVVLLLQALPNC